MKHTIFSILLAATLSVQGVEQGSTYLKGTVDAGGSRVRSVADPVAGTDAVNKQYMTNYVATAEVTEVNDLSKDVVWTNVPNANITEGSVTQHQAAITITESQISDLSHTVEVNDLSSVVTWADVPNVNITEGSVTQHQAALTITESQISDLNHTVEVNDLSSVVTWADVPDANITEGSVTQHQAALTITESQISDLSHTVEANDLSSVVTWADVPNANITEGSVTQHQGAITITESQISDLSHTVEVNDLSSVVTWADVPNINITEGSVTQHQGAITITESQISDLSHTVEVNDLSSVVTWADVPDANVTQSAVTQHQAAITITESQISDLNHTVEVNDLSSVVTWADVPDANITQSSVTQHQGAITITESQISDLSHPPTDLSYDVNTRLLESSTGTDVTLPQVSGACDYVLDAFFTPGANAVFVDSGLTVNGQPYYVSTDMFGVGQDGYISWNGSTYIVSDSPGGSISFLATCFTFCGSIDQAAYNPDLGFSAGGQSFACVPNDGLMTVADKTKLDGIEDFATADQNASEVPYSNATSGLTSTDVQAAIDEVALAGGSDNLGNHTATQDVEVGPYNITSTETCYFRANGTWTPPILTDFVPNGTAFGRPKYVAVDGLGPGQNLYMWYDSVNYKIGDVDVGAGDAAHFPVSLVPEGDYIPGGLFTAAGGIETCSPGPWTATGTHTPMIQTPFVLDTPLFNGEHTYVAVDALGPGQNLYGWTQTIGGFGKRYLVTPFVGSVPADYWLSATDEWASTFSPAGDMNFTGSFLPTQPQNVLNVQNGTYNGLPIDTQGTADNLGDHLATQDLDMSEFDIVTSDPVGTYSEVLPFSRMDNLESALTTEPDEILPQGLDPDVFLTMTQFVVNGSPSGSPITYNISGLTIDSTGVGNDSIDITFTVTTGGLPIRAGRSNATPFGWLSESVGWLNAPGRLIRVDFSNLSVNLNGGTGNGSGEFLGFTSLSLQEWDANDEQALINGVLKSVLRGDTNPFPIANENYVSVEYVAGAEAATFRVNNWDFQVLVDDSTPFDLTIAPGTNVKLTTPFVATAGDDVVNYSVLNDTVDNKLAAANSVTPVDYGPVDGVWAIDLHAGPVQLFTQVGPITDLLFVNTDNSNVESVEVILLRNTDSITWPVTIEWAEGVVPPTVANEYNRLIFSRYRSNISGAFLGSTP